MNILIPYIHFELYKDMVEKMVSEILKSRFIQPSHDPFASLVVLVKKKDNSLETLCGLQGTK